MQQSTPRVPIVPLKSWQIPPYEAFCRYWFLDGPKRNYLYNAARQEGKDFLAWTKIRLAATNPRYRPGDDLNEPPKPGVFYYLLNTLRNTKLIMVTALDPLDGRSKLEQQLGDYMVDYNKAEMVATLSNGSKVILSAVEHADRLRGQAMDGIVISEASRCKLNKLHEIIEPALRRQKGFRIYESTANGMNDFYDQYLIHKDGHDDPASPYHYTEAPTSMSEEEQARTLEEFIAVNGQSMGTDLYRQEYECSFDIGTHGSIYDAGLVNSMVTEVSYDPKHPVYASFDIGWNDHTAYWLYQHYGGRFHFLSTYQNTRQGIEHYLSRIETEHEYREKPRLFLPHDAANVNVGSGSSVLDMCRNYGYNATVLKKALVIDQLNDVRRHLQVCDVDRDGCKEGVRSLLNYRRDWSTDRMQLSDTPVHDKYSDLADAFRYAIVSRDHMSKGRRKVTERRPELLSCQ